MLQLSKGSLIPLYHLLQFHHILNKPWWHHYLKKPGLELIPKNYRPVSNLSFISKITERAISYQMNTHLEKYGLREPLQSAYRYYHSTETALVKIFDDLLMSMDKQQVVLLTLLDLSAAFDTVNHSILLHRLKYTFGVTDLALQWLTSYLSRRSQIINIHGVRS